MAHRRESTNVLPSSRAGMVASPSRRDVLRHESPRYYRKPVRVARTVQRIPVTQRNLSDQGRPPVEAIIGEPVLSERTV
ncbi:unnamed protein product [Dibothriocephalus latus]|uniref:Uncharacterized protein n=1 Tax=Dibothriocephalus latus TaxID=60516 RepID=A0A3P7MDP4_DIBLA|nr:unnamed protein product [Dibothriocephalus latus]